jgi:drug/metabolite transporter (DMT)-like permease
VRSEAAGAALETTVEPRRPVARGALFAATLGLFLVWSNTFLAFEMLLAPLSGPAPMRWSELAVARFVPATLVCAAWCLASRRREALLVVRRHPIRLAASALLAGPAYGAFMYYGISRRVSGPVASLLTTLSPLYLLVLGACLFGERIGRRQAAGLFLGFAGVVVVATAREAQGVSAWDVAVLALAQVCWSVYSVLTKPVLRTVPPLLWTYLVIVAGGVPLLLLAPFHGGPAMLALDLRGWVLLLYLSIGATVLGNAVWSWLLRHLPASTTGLTIFLNPPLTTASKWALSLAFPLHFAFAIEAREWVGGGLALLGVALAVLQRPPAVPRAEKPEAAPRAVRGA